MARLVTFDVVNTILKVRHSGALQYARAANACGLATSRDDIQAIYKPTLRAHRRQHPLYGAYQGLTSEQFWRSFVHRIFNELGYGDSYDAVDKAADMLISDFMNDPAMWEFLPGALDVLEELRASGLRQGVISNFDNSLTRTLQSQKLDKYFDFTVTCIDAMAEKPDLRIFEHALRLAQVKPRECVHIGDDVEQDFFAARRVGMNAILVNTGGKLTTEQLKEVPADLVVNTLGEIPALIKQI